MPVFLENFPQKLLVSTRCDLGDMVECVLTVMATPLSSRDVRPPFFDVLLLTISSQHFTLCNVHLQLNPRPLPPTRAVSVQVHNIRLEILVLRLKWSCPSATWVYHIYSTLVKNKDLKHT